MLFTQFIHAVVLDNFDAHQNPQDIGLTEAHHHHNSHYDHSHSDEDHDDGFASLHDALHDLQITTLPTGTTLLTTHLVETKLSSRDPDIFQGLSLSPPVPPPLS